MQCCGGKEGDRENEGVHNKYRINGKKRRNDFMHIK